MQNVRGNLTRLKTLAEKTLPDESDIFGFSGISKALIVKFIDDAHAQSYSLQQMEPKFEITILKRKLAKLLDDCKEFLSDGVKNWAKERKFDDFLTNLTHIRDEIRITYLVVIDKSLRVEEDTARLVESYEQLSAAHNKYLEEFNEIEQRLKAVQAAHEQSTARLNEITSASSQSQELFEQIRTVQSESAAKFDITSKYEQEIRDKREIVVDLSSKLLTLEDKAKSTTTAVDGLKEQCESIIRDLGAQTNENERQQQEIQDTLDNANRMGMAGSFKSRKDELDLPIRIWGGVFVAAVVLIFVVAWYFVAPYLTAGGEVKYPDLLIKISLAAPFIWLAWMSVKQYGYLSRIREDYAYKYASAMAFEGYKKHAKEIDPELLQRLLAVSVENLSQNPIRLFDVNNNHGSPFHELARDAFSKIPTIGKASEEGAK